MARVGSGFLWGLGSCVTMGNPGFTQTTCKTRSSVLGVWDVQSSALLQPGREIWGLL